MPFAIQLSSLTAAAILSDVRYLAGASLLSLFLWQILISSGQNALSALRKFLLLMFFLFLISPYVTCARKVKSFVLTNVDFNALSQCFSDEYKGTDWSDGVVSASLFFIFLFILYFFWGLEKKASKPPAETPPFKIDARIGNINDAKK